MHSHILIGIHGLANKPPHDVLSAGWKAAIEEGLRKNEKLSHYDIDFQLVYWADVLYDAPDEDPENRYREAEPGAIKTYQDHWWDEVRAEAFDLVGDVLDGLKRYFGMDAVADHFLAERLKDLARYYEDANIRETLRERLKQVLIAHQDKRILLLAHSMGTIIAYDALRQLGRHDPRLVVDHFVTLGSPLGLPHVKYKISRENPPPRTPSVVRRWSNFADRRDPVAADVYLAGDYEPNSQGVVPEDDLVSNDWAGLHHKSYGYLRTPEVSRLIRRFL